MIGLHSASSMGALLWRTLFILCSVIPLFGSAQAQDTSTALSKGERSLGASSQSHLALGRAYGAKGQWRDAERELRIYRNSHHDSVEAIVLHAESLIQLGQPFDAALELQKFLQTHPDSVRPLELHATLASETLRDKPLAQAELEKVTSLAPTNSRAWKALAQIYMDQDDMKSAIPTLQHAATLSPKDAVIAASLAYAFAETNQPERAQSQFQKALRLADPASKDSAIVQMLYGRFQLENGKPQDSVASFTSMLKVDPNYALGFYWRARAYQQLNNFDAAEADALESIRLDPDAREAPLLLVNIYRKQGRTDKAEEYAQMVTRLSDQKEAQQAKGRKLRDDLNQAEHLLLAGNFAEAAPFYESIVQTLPSYYEAYFDLGMCYAQTAKPTEAEAAFRKYLTFQPISSDGHASLGVLLLYEGRGSEAIPELEQAIQMDPSLVEARKALATEYLRESQPESAVAILRIQSSSQDKDLCLLAAEAYRQLGNFPAALHSVDRALAFAPSDPAILALKRQIETEERGSIPRPPS
jgi:tetratricopeptide (TPR) repeat protein